MTSYFTEQALTSSECLKKIHDKYGVQAKVLTQRTVRIGGILGIGGRDGIEMTGTLNYGISQSEPNFEDAKRKTLAAAAALTGKDPMMQTVIRELRNLNEKVDAVSRRPVSEETRHPSLARLEEDFAANDFSPSYTQAMIERARREFALEDLEDYDAAQRRVVEWIGESISVYREKTPRRKKPHVMVLVGATGVGKTTTLAKLTWLFGERVDGRWKNEVRLVTLDNYRIGGKQQIEKYGELMEIPVSSVENYEGLRTVLALYRRDIDFVLVDTIGKSPRNYGDLGEMKAALEACGPRAEVQLCIAASTKSSDIAETLKQFEPFRYESVIVTKLDETGRVGNIISALSKYKKSVSFITTGQGVPADIERATVMRFLLNLEGFVIDREELSKRFPDDGEDQAEGDGVSSRTAKERAPGENHQRQGD